MYNRNQITRKYKDVLINTTISKTKQVVMLYEAVINFVKLAKKSIVEGNIQERYNNTEKAVKIIDGLYACLDKEKGGEVAVLLSKFYVNIYTKIMNINIINSPEVCDVIIDEIKLMKDAWVEVDIKFNSTTESSNQEQKNNPQSGIEFSA